MQKRPPAKFNIVTPKNEMKFGPIHPSEAVNNFANADAIVEFATSHRMAAKGRTPYTLANPPRVDDIASNVGALGPEVHFSELDVRIQQPFTDEKIVQQADVYRSIANICTQARNCPGLTLWGFTDKYSWITNQYPGNGAALIFDTTYLKKPAYQSFCDALSSSERTHGAAWRQCAPEVEQRL